MCLIFKITYQSITQLTGSLVESGCWTFFDCRWLAGGLEAFIFPSIASIDANQRTVSFGMGWCFTNRAALFSFYLHSLTSSAMLFLTSFCIALHEKLILVEYIWKTIKQRGPAIEQQWNAMVVHFSLFHRAPN